MNSHWIWLQFNFNNLIHSLYPALWWVLLLWTRMVPPHSGASSPSPSDLHLQTETKHQQQARGLWLPENAAVVQCGLPHRALLWAAKTSVSRFLNIRLNTEYSLLHLYLLSITEPRFQVFEILHIKWHMKIGWAKCLHVKNENWNGKKQLIPTVSQIKSTCTEDPRNQTAYNDTAHFVIFLDILHSLKHLKDIF